MHHRIVLLHGWGADADDLRPVGDALSKEHPSPLEVICLSAPEARPEASGRQWYDLFPARWDRVPEAVALLRRRLLHRQEALTLLRLTSYLHLGVVVAADSEPLRHRRCLPRSPSASLAGL